jgi:PDZ domain-containing protein
VPDVPGPDSRAPQHVAPRHRARLSRWNVAVVVVFFLGLAVVVAGSLVRLPYAIVSPGPTFNALGQETLAGKSGPVISIEGLPTYPADGSLRFLTVVISGGPGHPVDAWDLLGAWLDPARDIYPVDELFDPRASEKQVAEESAVEMESSQEEAKAVALRAIGQHVPSHVFVASVLPTSKAKGVLEDGDQLVSVDGVKATDPDAIRAALQRVEPGHDVRIEVRRGTGNRTLEVPTMAAAGGQTAIGVMLGVKHDFPATVTISAGEVGGPSAGLMFALAIYDKLTPGSLTNNHAIAGTGTINEAEQVGPIGGIRQKLGGAKDAGASYFLAPAGNCPEVTGQVPDGLQVFKVASFDEALSAVKGIAAGKTADLPRC